MPSRSARKEGAAQSAEFARTMRLLDLYKQHGDWDQYLTIATSLRFQEDLAAEAVRTATVDAAGPIRVLGVALDQAVRLRRIGIAAALTLATARWTRLMSVRAVADADQAVEPYLAGMPGSDGEPSAAAEVELRTGRDVLRALLLSWERYDAGNRGAARSLLAAIVRARPPMIRTSDGDRWAVPLLRLALTIDPDAAAHLLDLVDDNVLGDLARELTVAGEYGRARVAGAAMRLFYETKADVLADLALAQAEAGIKQGTASRPETTGEVLPDIPIDSAAPQAVVETANLAVDAARQSQQDGAGASVAPRTPRIAGSLAKAAAALTLAGQNDLAARRWAEAMAAAEREPDPNRTLAEFAEAQIRAGLLDDAAQVIAVLLNESQTTLHDWQANAFLDPAWQAATALVTALAERRDVAGAVAALRMIPDFAHSYSRAVRALVGAIAPTEVPEAELLAGQLRDPDERGQAFAAIAAAALAAGNHRDALGVAGRIEHNRSRARAFVSLAGALGQADDISFDDVRSAIAAVTDSDERALLLAEFAVTLDTDQRRRLLAKALRQADKAPADARWRVLANIGVIAAEAGLTTEAQKAFASARRLLAKDPREWDFELYQLCRVQLSVGDTTGARETAEVALGAIPGRTTTGRLLSAVGASFAGPAAAPTSRRLGDAGRQPRPARAQFLDPAVAAADAADDIPLAVAALAAIACAIGGSAGVAAPGSERAQSLEGAESETGDEPGAAAGQIARVLAAAERLATGLPHGVGALTTDEALARAYTALGEFAVAERRILSLLPPPDPGAEESAGRQALAVNDEYDIDADGEDEDGDEIEIVTVVQERSIGLSDALVAGGESEQAARFMREVADRLTPFAWRIGPGAADVLAELAAAQVRAGDNDGARTTAAFAEHVASVMDAAFRLPEPLGSPMSDEANVVAAVVDAMTALMRDAEIGPADLAGARLRAVDYGRCPWQARARTLAAFTRTHAAPAERTRLVTLLAREQQQIWQLATVTFVRGATLDPGDAAKALALLAGAQAEIGELADARRAIAMARDLAADIEERDERAQALTEISVGLSAVGDHTTAVSTARELDHPAYQGQAMATAVTAAANAGAAADRMDLLAEARSIGDVGWRAIALVAVGMASAAQPDFAEAHALIARVAHGSPRAKVWQEIIGRCMAAGQYELAVGLTDEITDNAGLYLAVIAGSLGLIAADSLQSPDEASELRQAAARETAGDALLSLLPRCARYREAAYAACTALAITFPADAALVAGAVAQHADAVAASTEHFHLEPLTSP